MNGFEAARNGDVKAATWSPPFSWGIPPMILVILLSFFFAGLFIFVATVGARISLFLAFVVLIICLATVSVFAGESVLAFGDASESAGPNLVEARSSSSAQRF
jgi:hypothetical protein